ncbi:MAG: putative phospholipid ABC transporter permease protein MlaE [Elusimicrobia bacterium]|nr:putative phospholipid ABC transporter permease protein MlaE [Elusimicrobiota bacterium]
MKWVNVLGAAVLDLAESVGRVWTMSRKSFALILKGKWERSTTLEQMNEIGVSSFSVVGLTSLFTGMVLAFQSGFSFMKVFNEPIYVGSVVGLSLVKELGPVLTSVVIAGRVGAAITAELGTMNVTEQLDALYTLGTSPIRFLAVPRYIATMIMVPILTALANIIGIIGGFLVAMFQLKIPSSIYWDEVKTYVATDDVVHGLIKSFFFGLIIVTTSCFMGFNCSGGAEGVGRATTKAVVISMVLILVGDYFLSALLVSMGIGG